MSEGWKDWPLLGPGWKRRTAIRKSGQSCGHSDTYYQSPTGQRFRSKPELAKFLGDKVDLSCFNFKHGTLIPAEKRKTPKKKKKKASQTSPDAPTSPASPTSPMQLAKRLNFSFQSPDEHKQNGKETKTITACCSGCKKWFDGVYFGRSKATLWYCADCRATRRAFNKEQKLLKSAGCGKCSACSLTENCGCCSICLLRSHNPEFGSSWKCVERRCLKAIHKPGDCGECQGCSATEDCGACSVCLKRQKNPGVEIRTKCVKRRCHKKKSGTKFSVTKGFAAKKLKTKWRLMSERDGSSLPVKHKKKSYYNKVKGKTERKKPKEKYIPVNLKSSNHPVILERLQREKLAADDEKMETLKQAQEVKLLPMLPIIKLQRLDYRNGGFMSTEKKNISVNLKSSDPPVTLKQPQKEKSAADEEKMETSKPKKEVKLIPKLPIIKLERLDYRNEGYQSTEDGGGWIIGKKEIKQIKEECKESTIVAQEVQEEPLDLHCPVKSEEFIVESNDVEAADESTPVITQIFSLGSFDAKNSLDHSLGSFDVKSSLDHVLQELLAELNEIPLPAHWEVLSNVGSTLQLVQRSKASTMAETVVHIQPGLHFHVVVREYTVPSFHELYQTHPSRLTTVDDVLELICDLEAYRPCTGLPRRGPLSPNCHVLVYGEWCPECVLNPWPSGFVR